VLAASLAVATDNGRTPVWLLVAGPALLVVGVIWLWVLVKVIVPRLRNKQPTESA
jgi:hypothetical protein